MKHLLEIHILQNFAPSNLNRDDTGSPKDAFFGGYRRGRISSQCLKRAAREYVRDNKLLDEKDLATRTKRISQVVAKVLHDDPTFGLEENEAGAIARTAVSSIVKYELKKKGDKTDHLTKALIFLNGHEAMEMAKVCFTNLEQLRKISGEAAEQARIAIETSEEEVARLEEKAKEASDKEEKAALKKELSDAKKRLTEAKRSSGNVEMPEDIKTALKKVFESGRRSVDVALFGRMLAGLPRKERDDAACQVAHAISTNSLEREFDYYTAVDDLNPSEDTGAGMLGTIEFGSSCFYRYIALDVNKLLENLGGDKKLTLKSINAFLKAIVKAKPSGKQNSFAAHNDPEYVAVSVRTEADPRNLANAFEKPIRPGREQSLTEASVKQLEAKWVKLARAYGQNGQTFVLNLTDFDSQIGEPALSLEELLGHTEKAVKASLGV